MLRPGLGYSDDSLQDPLEQSNVSLLYASQFTPITKRTLFAIWFSLTVLLGFEIVSFFFAFTEETPMSVFLIFPVVFYFILVCVTFIISGERLRLRRRGYLNFYRSLTRLVPLPLGIYSFFFVLIFIFMQLKDHYPKHYIIDADDHTTELIQVVLVLITNFLTWWALVAVLYYFILHNQTKSIPDISNTPSDPKMESISGDRKQWKNPNAIIDRQSGAIMFLQGELKRTKEELALVYEDLVKDNGTSTESKFKKQFQQQLEQIRTLRVQCEELRIENERVHRKNSEMDLALQDLKRQHEELNRQHQTLMKEKDHKKLEQELQATKILLNVAREDSEKYRMFFEQFNPDLMTIDSPLSRPNNVSSA